MHSGSEYNVVIERVRRDFDELDASHSLAEVVNWMVRSGISESEAKSCRGDFLRCAAIAKSGSGLFDERPAVLPEGADSFFHHFLLFNVEYGKWCQDVFGRVLNHFPGKATATGWRETREALEAAFGTKESFAVFGTSSVSFASHPAGFRPWPAIYSDCGN